MVRGELCGAFVTNTMPMGTPEDQGQVPSVVRVCDLMGLPELLCP